MTHTSTLECQVVKEILPVVLRNVETIKIWDLESKSIVEDLKVNLKTKAEKVDDTTTSSVSTHVFLL
jgi:hypothetical protein